MKIFVQEEARLVLSSTNIAVAVRDVKSILKNALHLAFSRTRTFGITSPVLSRATGSERISIRPLFNLFSSSRNASNLSSLSRAASALLLAPLTCWLQDSRSAEMFSRKPTSFASNSAPDTILQSAFTQGAGKRPIIDFARFLAARIFTSSASFANADSSGERTVISPFSNLCISARKRLYVITSRGCVSETSLVSGIVRPFIFLILTWDAYDPCLNTTPCTRFTKSSTPLTLS